MDFESPSNQNITLVYHDFRGFGQLIRSLLYYMNVPFSQILVKRGENFKKMEFPVDTSGVDSLPFIIDNGKLIGDNTAIIFYICKRFGHQRLLGQNICERAKIRQIFGKFIDKYSLKMKVLFTFIQKIIENPNNVIELKKQTMLKIRSVSSNIDPLYNYALTKSSKYLLGKITLLDFVFYESCFYVTNCFSDVEQEPCKIKNIVNSILGTDFGKQDEDIAKYLKTLKEYKIAFQAEEFYVKNKEKLQSYPVSCPNFDEQMIEAYKKVWVGPKHFFH